MTFEKGRDDNYPRKTEEQFLAQWTSVLAAVDDEELQMDWAESWAESISQGRQGDLQANVLNFDGREIENEVPSFKVRSYFLQQPDDEIAQARVQRLIRTLQLAGVSVREIISESPVARLNYKPYGSEMVPEYPIRAGTYFKR